MTDLKDYIMVYDNIIPDDVCNLILNEYKNCDDWTPSYINDQERLLNKQLRNSDNINITQQHIIDKNVVVRKEIDQKVFQFINDTVRKYVSLFPPGSINISSDTGYNLLRYKKGQYISQHIDTSIDISRILSCSIGLNDEYTGGEFAFFNASYKFKLKKGSVLMFPSNFLYPHEVLPVISGIRYSILTWLF